MVHFFSSVYHTLIRLTFFFGGGLSRTSILAGYFFKKLPNLLKKKWPSTSGVQAIRKKFLALVSVASTFTLSPSNLSDFRSIYLIVYCTEASLESVKPTSAWNCSYY